MNDETAFWNVWEQIKPGHMIVLNGITYYKMDENPTHHIHNALFQENGTIVHLQELFVFHLHLDAEKLKNAARRL